MTTVTITGTDGVVPIRNTEARWQSYALAEVFDGNEGANRYVPNVHDYVEDYDKGLSYIVVAVDETTLLSTLKERTSVKTNTDTSSTDIFMGDTPDTYRAYYDSSVTPATLTVDQRGYVRGTTCKYAQLFKGNVLNGTMEVVSALYDQSYNLVSTNIPLELSEAPTVSLNGTNLDIVNYTVKTVKPCNTTHTLVNGEELTLVLYADDGGVVSMTKLLVVATKFVRGTDASQKYVTGISLETPWLSETNPSQIQYPINVPLAGMNLFGKVHYSDGSSSDSMAVDGTKFEIMGFREYVATIIGASMPVTLKYNYSTNEIGIGTGNVSDRFVTKHYDVITTRSDGNYNVKLFAYPVWVDATNGYRLQWFLLNLDRKIYYDVTPYVKLGSNSAAFRSTAYGYLQELQYCVNLNDVDPSFKSWTHTQTIEITLVRAATDQSGTSWTVGYVSGQNPPFGKENKAVLNYINENLSTVTIDQGETTQDAWLERVFYRTLPVFDPATEDQAPTPNMFSVIVNTKEYEFTINQWNKSLTIEELVTNAGTLYVKFFKRTGTTDMILGVSGLPLWQKT